MVNKAALNKSDEASFQEIVNAHFPGAKSFDVNAEFEAKFASAHPDASAFTKEKASYINQITHIRHSLLVLKTDTKIVEDVAGVMGASC